MTEPNLLFGDALSPDGSAAALLGQDAKLRVQTGSEPPGIVDIACPEMAAATGPVLGDQIVEVPAVADGATQIGVVHDDGVCLWSPDGGAPLHVGADVAAEAAHAVAIDGPGIFGVVGTECQRPRGRRGL